MSLPRSFTSLAIALALSAAIPLPAAFAGGDVIPPRTLGRKFPVGQFCPLPISISFTPPVSSVIVHFDAQVYMDNGFGTLNWTGQAIDNVTIATTAQVAANFGPPCSSFEICYIDNEPPFDDGLPPPASYFYFSNPGLSFAHFELFDTDPTARGWDMSNGAYFVNSLTPSFSHHSAPRALTTAACSADETGGSLGLGPESTPASLSEVATTSITVNGLAAGTSYDLDAWWYANFTVFENPSTILTIRIETTDGTPVARKSWGGLKAGYKR